MAAVDIVIERVLDRVKELDARGIEDPQRYVYNHVAARLDPALMPFPTTEDFVVYAFIQPDIVETMENLHFSASQQALAILERKGLLQ